MENKIRIGYPAMIFLALLLLFVLNFSAAYSENPLLINVAQTIIIPCVLLIFYVRHKTISVLFIAFLLFSFLGDSTFWFLPHYSAAIGSNILYSLSYLALIAMGIPYFKPTKIDKVVGVYLFFILCINGYFLYTLCNLLGSFITDGTEMILFGAKSMTLLILVFISFAVYLSAQTKASILFLLMAICFAFSDILNYVTHYYIYNWSILMLDRLLHIIGLFFAFKFMVEDTHLLPKKVYFKFFSLKEYIFSRKISWLK